MRTTNRYGQLIFAAVLSLIFVLGATNLSYAADITGKIVTNVSVAGNKTVASSTILSAAKIKPGDKVTADKIKQDLQAIYELGYFYDVVTNFQEVPEGVKVVYTVMENPVLKDIVVKGNTKVTTEKLMGYISVPKGKILNTKTLNENMRKIEGYYHDQGYILAKVSDVGIKPDGVLTVTISEGILEGIQIKGNDKTKNYVITREMKLKPGEPFNVKDARRSMQRVYNLGYFEDVNMKLNSGREPNSVVLETSVVEQKTGTFAIGGGYSEDDGMFGIIELGDNNFRGTGDKVKIHWEFGGTSNANHEFSYTKPWLDSKQTSLGFSVYNMTNQYTDYYDDGDEKATYDKKRKGIEITLSRPQSEYIRNYITLKHRDDIYVGPVEGEQPQWYEDNPGDKVNNFGVTNSITLMHVLDSRDNIYNPTEGKRYSLSAEFAGFGGDFDFNKYTAEGRQYFKVGKDHVIATRLTVGYADGKMPDSGRFAVGGSDTLRGYKDEQFKGDKMVAATVEYRFPVAKKVQGVVFTDVGKAWEDEGYKLSDLEASIGVGVRVTTPIGPIRLDYAKGSQDSRFHFSFGGQF